MDDWRQRIETLCRVSRNAHVNPYTQIEWPEAANENAWYLSPEFLSLHGTPHLDALDDAARRRLSLLEACNLFSLTVHGEMALIQDMTRRLFTHDFEEESAYLLHFIEEEVQHMVYFSGFCMRYAGKLYPDRKLVLPREHAPGEEDFLFFARVFIFEELVDAYNAAMASDERLSPVVRQIHRLHHVDESRHLAFGRDLVAKLFARYRDKWSAAELAGVREYLAAYLRSTWKEYYNPDVYRDAGLAHPLRVRDECFEAEYQREHRARLSARLVDHLMQCGILEAPPAL